MPRVRLSLLVGLFLVPLLRAAEPDTLPGTKALTMKGDIASQLVDGVDKFLLRETAEAAKGREKFWKRDFSSAAAYDKSIEPNRKRLAHILGVRDKRVAFDAPELVATIDQPALVGKGANYEVYAVRWPVIGNVHGEGLLLRPTKGKAVADVVAIPDADVTPEQLCGLMPGVKPEAQYARRLAESGCRVLVPTLIDRTYAPRNGRAKMTSREYIYRSAFELGRHVIGYDLQKILAGVDWFAKEKSKKIGVIGWGEGGMLALYAGALDTRIGTVCVSGFLGDLEETWKQPVDRNVFGLLKEFGEVELFSMVAPRTLVLEASYAPKVKLPSEGGAPGEMAGRDSERCKEIMGILEKTAARFEPKWKLTNVRTALEVKKNDKGNVETSWNEALTPTAVGPFLESLAGTKLAENGSLPDNLRKAFDPKVRQQRQLRELDTFTQALLEESPYVRRDFMPIADQFGKPDDQKKLDTSSVAAYEESVERYREIFATEVIGRFDNKMLPANPRTKKLSENDKWTMYQVVLDVYPDVIAYGLLVIPKGIKADEKRPVVVCQHGLEGRPEDTIGEPGFPYYKAFTTKLAERGFITFAPQNLYIFKDRFRTLQRKANPLGKTLFSVIVPQHQQITDWLMTLPNVDGKRIGFYGLSYGGKSAMRIPPLVKNYALSICSADFNDWVWKNANTRATYSYVWTGEYEIFEWDLGSTFNYAEMAALIAPRPFMVERGHFDGVGPDDRVGLEFAKVRHLYQAKLKIGDRATIEWFVGPHTINSTGTFAFLHKHLNWPKKN